MTHDRILCIAVAGAMLACAVSARAQDAQAPSAAETPAGASALSAPPPQAPPSPQPAVLYGQPAPVLYAQPAPPPTSTGPAEPIVRRRPNWSLIAPGVGLFAGGWLTTWITTVVWYDRTTSCVSSGWLGWTCSHAGPDDTALGWSFLPLIGPWIMLSSDGLRGADLAFPVVAGLAQATGLVLLIAGVATPQTIVRTPTSRDARSPQLSLTVRGAGLSLELSHF